jgi:hypothetical protein
MKNKHPCPACNRSLWWDGVTVSQDKFNIEGKRWYQYASRRTCCKYCGVRLLDKFGGKFITAFVIYFFLYLQFVVYPFKNQYGLFTLFPFVLSLLALRIFLARYDRYKIWESKE